MATSSATVTSATIVNAYQTYYVSSGVTVLSAWSDQTIVGIDPTDENGGSATINIANLNAGATGVNDTAGLLGAIVVSNGGTAIDVAATSGGAIIDVGAVSGASIGNSAALLVFGNTGVATDPHIASGGQLYVGDVGALSTNTSINGYLTSKGVQTQGTGVVSGGTIDAGGTETLGLGGTDVASIIHGEQFASAGAVMIDVTVDNGGVQILSGGAVTTSTTVGSGGTTIASSGAFVSDTIISGGSVLLDAGAVVFGGVVEENGELVVSAGATALNVTVSSGGSEIVQSGGTISGGTVLTGGTEIVSAGATSLNVTITSGGSLVVATGAELSGTVVSQGAVIDIDTLAYISGGTVQLDGNTLTITEGGTTWSTILSGTYQSTDYFVIGEDGDGSTTLTFVCFCAGTLIRTDNGEAAVETLKIGDQVLTYADGREVLRPVTWVGRRTASVRADLPLDMAGYPVRILKDAIAPNVPHQDLLITPEHCLYLNGVFVPVRMLVNGRSIFYDLSMTHYEYFHVETDGHSILWANGTLSESYLDTGNRREFGQQGNVVRFVNRATQDWTSNAAAPLGVTRDVVEPIYRALENRAAEMQMDLQAAPLLMTNDADLHLVTSAGHRLNPVRKDEDGKAFFMLPSGVNEVRIVSRASRPSDTTGPFVDDRRMLGVLVGKVAVWSGRVEIPVESHLAEDDLAGWTVRETGAAARWTTGDALLRLPERSDAAVSLLVFEVLQAGPYVVGKSGSDVKVIAS